MKNGNKQLVAVISAFFLLGITGLAQAAPTLTVGISTGSAGTSVLLPITFNPGTSSVVGLQFTLTLATGLSLASAAPIPGTILGSGASNKVIKSNGNTFLVVGFYNDVPATGACSGTVNCGNLNTIASGKLMDIQMNIAAGTPVGPLNVAISTVVYADNTNSPASCTGTCPGTQSIPPGASTTGAVNVTQFSPCDVNHSGAVDIGDGIFEVNGLLNPATMCTLPAMDLNQSGGCDVGDVIRIVNVVLGGACVTGP
jgi:hypothetical protein